MTQITLSPEQTTLLQQASFPVVILDSSGRKVAEIASIQPALADVQNMTAEEWSAESLRRRDQARREGSRGSTTQEVLARLRALKPE